MLLMLLAACATSYGSMGPTGGYTETLVGPRTFRVEVRANGLTSRSRAQAMVLVRAAELTLQNGYQRFALGDPQLGAEAAAGLMTRDRLVTVTSLAPPMALSGRMPVAVVFARLLPPDDPGHAAGIDANRVLLAYGPLARDD